MTSLAVLLLVLLAVVSLCCGILLWKRREAPADRSRTLLAFACWGLSFLSVLYVVRACSGTLPVQGPLLAPEHVFAPVLAGMVLLLYPLELIRPMGDRAVLYLRMYGPLVAMLVCGLCGGIAYTPIVSLAHLVQHLGEWNVWIRLLAWAVIPFYAFLLPCNRVNWRETYTSKGFLRIYAGVLCLMGLLQGAVQFTHSWWLYFLQLVFGIVLVGAVTWYELCERLWIRREKTERIK